MLVCGISFSQKTTQNQRDWFAYIGQYKVSEKWGVQLEAQFRMDNGLEQNLQNLFRVGGIYYLSQNKNIIGGYALITTFSPSLNQFFKENRAWEQFQINKKWQNNKNSITHRFRLEQRWVEKLTADVSLKNTTNYQNRFRYLNRNLFHLFYLNSENEEIYAVIQDEIFLNIGDNKINSKFIDQNRFLIGAGFNYNNSTRLELGFMNQFVTSSNGSNAMNHTVSFTLFQNLDFYKD
jgi:hypothetical protein